MSKTRHCGNCGSLEVTEQKSAGPFPWKDFPAAFLLKPLPLLTCKKCGEHLLRHGDTERLDKAIEESISKITQTLISEIIRREKCTQEELALRIGITPQHLSNLKSGAKTPGFQTFNFLKTLYLDDVAFDKANPEINVGELKVANG